MSPFLCTDIIDYSQGKCCFQKVAETDLLKREEISFIAVANISFQILSGPGDLFLFEALILDLISASVIGGFKRVFTFRSFTYLLIGSLQIGGVGFWTLKIPRKWEYQSFITMLFVAVLFEWVIDLTCFQKSFGLWKLWKEKIIYL